MQINKREYIGSYVKLEQCPPPNLPEYAFIGRSNVGKSSLINMITNDSTLAHTSNQPGKTQTINYFLIDEAWYLVDLPGYGYARTSKKLRKAWRKMIETYLTQRPNLSCVFLLVDSCVPPQAVDLEFANWLGESQIPFVMVFTKTDRKKSKKNKGLVDDFNKEMLKTWNALPQQFMSSAKTREGRGELLRFINEVNQRFYE